MPIINRANTNSLWSSILVETLVRCGLKHVVISPGSRSAPLAVAFAAHPRISSIPVLDERSAGFFALGLAKQTHQPVALVCTSGTAAVNYFPAVVEASESRVPLLVFTADRPAELQDCGAGQTINQVRLYGDYPVFQELLEIPSCERDELLGLKHSLVNAYAKSCGGPVHMNVPFRDPLHPVADGSTDGAPEIIEDFFADVGVASVSKVRLAEPVRITARTGIIICGTEMLKDQEAYCQRVAELSEKSGWPVLADGISPVRNHAGLQERLVTCYDLLLRNPDLKKILRPECVIALGPLPTSKELRNWLTESELEMYHVHRTGKKSRPDGFGCSSGRD